MESKKYRNPLDSLRSVVLSYREIWLLTLLVNSKLRELEFMSENSCFVDPSYLKQLGLLSESFDSLISEAENDLPF